MKKSIVSVLFVAFAMLGSVNIAHASSDAEKPPKMEWSFSGPFGTYDKAAMQRGFLVFKSVCASCHSMKRVAFRNLEALGYDEGQIKAIAAEYTVMDGPDDEGEMFERAARPSDMFPSPFANDAAAKYANNGAFPPDLSLITKARVGGADYLHAILTGYEDAPAHVHLMPGQYYNKYMSGGVIAMPTPLMDDQVEYEDGTPTTVDQYASDVSHFLNWAAEPELEVRKRMGVKVIIFLIVFGFVMYGVKRKIWSDLH
jgi:ubiquinol-cytochrome c reductase cytochrome c1 subunit|tara:strand:+ start:4302 stop:5069 length:768 start_codon:yes stop_codon:yes gene_type:complete